jgi:hypothetical protein
MPGDHHPRLRLFARRDCEICDALQAALLGDARIAALGVEVIDIDEFPEWRPQYHFRVPVLVRGETELWAGAVMDDTLEELFASVLSK